MALRVKTDYEYPRSLVPNKTEQLVFSLFNIAMAGFIAQGLISFYANQILGENFLVPPQVILVWCAYFLLFLNGRIRRFLRTYRNWKRPVFFGVMIIVFNCIRSGVFEQNWPRLILYSFQTLTGILIFLIIYYMAFYERWLRRLIAIIFLCCIATSAAAFYELINNFNLPWSQHYYQSEFVEELRGVPAGFEAGSVAFPYSVIFPIILASVALLTQERLYAMPGRWWCIVTVIAGIGGLMLSKSRSGILGVAIGVLFGFILMKRQKFVAAFGLILLSIPIIILLFPFMVNFFGKGSSLFNDSRIYLTWRVYLPTAIMYPFGLGYQDITQEILWANATLGMAIDSTLLMKLQFIHKETVAILGPHNLLLSNHLRYGWVGIIAIIGIYRYILRQGIAQVSNLGFPTTFRHTLAAIVGSIIGILGHCLFHNANIFMGEMRNWAQLGMLCGVIVAAYVSTYPHTDEPVPSSLSRSSSKTPFPQISQENYSVKRRGKH